MNTRGSALPTPDYLPIELRCYTTPKWQTLPDHDAGRPRPKRRAAIGASPWTLVFDTETATDAGQALKFGTYQLRNSRELVEAGILYDPEGVTSDELELLTTYAEVHRQMLRTRDDFVDQVFFATAYQLGAMIVGFNLPFDLSRLAISYGSARTPKDGHANAMHGGFTFKLSRQKIYPNLRIKHLSSRSALISFAAPMGQRDPRGQRKRGIRRAVRRGYFCDIKTLSAALFAKSFSLASLSAFLRVPNPKLEFDDFDGPITDAMIAYAVRDTQTTWDCYEALLIKFGELGLSQTEPNKIKSEAGIGKAYLQEMGISPWRKMQPDMPTSMIGKIMGTYFGGRSEVRIRREIRQVMLCDFLSMYPTVCTLMGLWRFVIAKGMTWRDSTAETIEALASVKLGDLQAKDFWRSLVTLVRVKLSADIFPVRAVYPGASASTIGLNYLTTEGPIWFTLADCINSKLLTGKMPEVLEAITFEPGPIQDELRPFNVAGNPDYRVDPTTDDLFKRIIELRQSVKARMKSANPADTKRLDVEQHLLKILANSTSYGIWVETNVETRSQRTPLTVIGSTCQPFSFDSDKCEMPGKFFHPLLATLITGAARLMLGIAETLATSKGLDWCFCDTDSMAFAKPHTMGQDDFMARVAEVVNQFAALNPYDFEGSILKVEDVNGALGNGSPEPLFCLAISSKRYALFNIGSDGAPIMRKVSAHGLGHLLPPYDAAGAPTDIPASDASVLRDGTLRWHSDFWSRIVCATMSDKPTVLDRSFHPAMHAPAVSRYAATSPDLLRWFKAYNEGRAYRDQVKPFNFMLSFREGARDGLLCAATIASKMGARSKVKKCKPVAPFDKDHGRAVAQAFDREAGLPICTSQLQTYAETLAQYHLSPESKFLDADYVDSGITKRRHVHVAGVIHIGKEAHDWERKATLGINPESEIAYGPSKHELATELQNFIAEFGPSKAAKALAIPAGRLSALASQRVSSNSKAWGHKAAVRLPAALRLCRKARDHQDGEKNDLISEVEREGLRKTARRLGVDPSNLRRRIKLT